MKHIAITRRYWRWQQKQMLKDDVGYVVSNWLRPKAIKWIPANQEPGGLTKIPYGWKLAPGEQWQGMFLQNGP